MTQSITAQQAFADLLRQSTRDNGYHGLLTGVTASSENNKIPRRSDDLSAPVQMHEPSQQNIFQADVPKTEEQADHNSLSADCLSPEEHRAFADLIQTKLQQQINLVGEKNSSFSLDLTNKNITDAQLAVLHDLLDLNLKKLNLAKLNLQGLNLSNCKDISDGGLYHLAKLTGLQSLNLSNCNKITDAGLRHLAGLINLQLLGLAGCTNITTEGVKHLAGLASLQFLNLINCKNVTDMSPKHLTGFTRLQPMKQSNSEKTTDGDDYGFKGMKNPTELLFLIQYPHHIPATGIYGLKCLLMDR